MQKKSRDIIVGELLGLYRELGSSDYIGEAVTQTQHALQAARQAQLEGHDNEVGDLSCVSLIVPGLNFNY